MGIPFLKLTGILSELFLLGVFFYSNRIIGTFNYSKHTISYLGTSGKVGIIFNRGLLIYSLLRIVFISIILSYFSLWNHIWIILSLYLGFSAIIIAAIIPLSRHKMIHEIAGLLILIFSIVFIFILGIQLMSIDSYLGTINLFLASAILIGSTSLIFLKGINSYFEIYFIFLVVVWDIVMTSALI